MVAFAQKKKMASLTLLSIMLPISLLATFRLTGVIQEPPTPQIITVETVSWNMSRPSNYIILDVLGRNHYSDDIVSVNFSINIVTYHENEEFFP
jgi:hypothetical protein